MQKAKRIIVATLSGVLFGFVCFGLASFGAGKLAWPIAVQIIVSRTLIGFAIGISCLSMRHWSIHGLIMGAIFSLPLAFSGLMAPESGGYSKASMLIGTIVLGMVYGLLIELITSLLFKAKAQS
ncbi:MAG: hypothetical protein AMJ46_00345 [Latescibacteria bacterium DG_63]|nr:MAG: hypothetical protein AMJ46_00345 [Latescibacteria bacterium DG_63]